MRRGYFTKNLLLVSIACLTVSIISCSKDKTSPITSTTPKTATPAKVGLYESDSSIYKLLYIDVSQVGTQTVDDYQVFDTGSGGMVLDAQGVLPATMITSTGFNFTGDSTVVDGITITNQTSYVEYGDDANSSAKVYGNLAYASVIIDAEGGKVTIKRLPFFLYYKAVDDKGNVQPAHEFDVFGVNCEDDITFSGGSYITSPFSYYAPGTGLTSGFKMVALGTSNFSLNGTYVPGVVTLGLTGADLSSSGFSISHLSSYPGEGYVPIIPATVTYNGTTDQTDALFDTGTEPYNYIEDDSAPATLTVLPANTAVTVATTSGFNWDFTVSDTDYLTNVENPKESGVTTTIFSLEFFLNNQYLLDFTDHTLGLKSN